MSNIIKMKPRKVRRTKNGSGLRSKSTTVIIVVGVLLGLVAGAALPMTNGNGTTDTSSLTGKARIVDGDTLWIGDVKIRLNGIDAPEAHQNCQQSDGSTYRCGEKATKELKSLVGSALVRCDGESKDRYGRLIATCYVGTMDLNAKMVSLGWAFAFRKYSQEYVSEEQIAKQAKLGMWSGKFQMPWDWRHGQRAKTTSVTSPPTEDCQIKGNISKNGKIYHLPGSRDYDKTRINTEKGERWLCSEEEAVAAGWRKAN